MVSSGDNDWVVFGCHDNHLYCLDQDTGQLIWSRDCRSPIYASPFIINEGDQSCILCNSSDGVLFLFKLDGSQVLEDDLFKMKNSSFSSPIFYNRMIFIGCRDNNLYRIDLEWKNHTHHLGRLIFIFLSLKSTIIHLASLNDIKINKTKNNL